MIAQLESGTKFNNLMMALLAIWTDQGTHCQSLSILKQEVVSAMPVAKDLVGPPHVKGRDCRPDYDAGRFKTLSALPLDNFNDKRGTHIYALLSTDVRCLQLNHKSHLAKRSSTLARHYLLWIRDVKP